MHLTRLRLRDFRNYEHAELGLGTGPQLLLGANGQGKTNLVEAVGCLATLASHRVSSDAALVRAGCEQALVQGELVHGSRRVELEVRIRRSGANLATVSGRRVRGRELSRYVATVLFAPEDLALVRGEPAQRREHLDRLLGTRSPRLGAVVADYERVLRQRNSVLRHLRRSGAAGSPSLEVWDERLVALGTEIIAERAALVSRMADPLARAYTALAGREQEALVRLRVSALSEPGTEAGDEDGTRVPGGSIAFEELRTRFAERLLALREREIERGQTLVGPHRDDAVLMLNGLPARSTASHGESWSYALALKLAALELLREVSLAGDPVLILDDVFAELDGERRKRLGDAIQGVEQILITAAVLEDVPVPLRASPTRIEAGRVLPDDGGSR